MLKSGNIGSNPSETLYILAKYYKYEKQLKPKQIYSQLNSFMLDHYLNYNPVRWTETLEKIIKTAIKHPLFNVEYIPITQNELEYISKINMPRLERIMFTFLCYAKFFNSKNTNNNNWVNIPLNKVMRSARVSATIQQQGSFNYRLIQMGLISLCNNIGKFNVKVVNVDTDGEVVLKIDDFRELGYEYMNWKIGGYSRCKHCGILFKQNKQGTRVYCKDCVKYQPVENKTIVCIDCGKEFKVDARDNQTNRCSECYKKYRKEYWAEIKRKSRLKEENVHSTI